MLVKYSIDIDIGPILVLHHKIQLNLKIILTY